MLASNAHADCFWSHVDHEVSYDDSGIWKASTYRTVSNTLTVANLAGALWEGTESRIGRTMWEAAERRCCPTRSPFRRSACSAAVAAALVTPWVLEYGPSNPAAYALLLLPAYVGAGRIKNQAHCQSDVAAGWAIGAGMGWMEHSRDRPFVLSLFPGGALVGFHKRF